MKIFIILLFALLIFFIGGHFFKKENLSLPSIAKPKLYRRVVSLAPSVCETIFALNQGHRLVGVSSHCKNTKAKSIDKVGTFASASFEKIISLKPDLVIGVPHVLAQPTLKRLSQTGIEIFAHQPDSLKDIKFIIRKIAHKLNVAKAGENLIAKFNSTIASAKADIANSLNSKEILIAVSSSPFVAAGPRTFPAEIIALLGFKNYISSSGLPWPVISLEAMMLKKPEIIFIMSGKKSWPFFNKIFNTINFNNSDIKYLVPEYGIFNSPSPLLIEDIEIFTGLVKKSFGNF